MKFLILFLVLFFGFGEMVYASKNCHLKFGAVPQFDQRKLFKIWNPILNHLRKEIGCQIIMVGSKNIGQFEEKFQKGVFDFAYMNPYHSVVAAEKQKYQAIIRSGAKKLKGILVVHKDYRGNLKNLEGKEISFPSPNALGASLLMRAELANKFGLKIKPKYVKTHNSVYLHVAKKLTEAGGGVLRTLNSQPKAIKDLVKIIYTTTPVNAHPLVAHPRLGTTRIDEIKSSLLKLARENEDLFKQIPMKKPISTNNDDYLVLKKMGLQNFAKKR